MERILHVQELQYRSRDALAPVLKIRCPRTPMCMLLLAISLWRVFNIKTRMKKHFKKMNKEVGMLLPKKSFYKWRRESNS